MVVDSIENGIVIDHITAGLGIKIFKNLNMKKSKSTVAFILNATSKKHGSKDIIKIENETNIDMQILGLIDPNATVSIIKEGKIVKKIKLELPKKVEHVIICKNPRCVTSVEVNAPHVFHLVDEANMEYACEYCDDIICVKNGNGLPK